METALRTFASERGVAAAQHILTFDFDLCRKRMSVVTRRPAGQVVAVKDAAEQLLPLCTDYYDGVQQVPMPPGLCLFER